MTAATPGGAQAVAGVAEVPPTGFPGWQRRRCASVAVRPSGLRRGTTMARRTRTAGVCKAIHSKSPAVTARLRVESLELLSKVGEGDPNRTARHQELGMVTLGEMIHEWAGHDLMHTVQGERAILQPFIDGCGPWKPYFSDHAVAPSPR